VPAAAAPPLEEVVPARGAKGGSSWAPKDPGATSLREVKITTLRWDPAICCRRAREEPQEEEEAVARIQQGRPEATYSCTCSREVVGFTLERLGGNTKGEEVPTTLPLPLLPPLLLLLPPLRLLNSKFFTTVSPMNSNIVRECSSTCIFICRGRGGDKNRGMGGVEEIIVKGRATKRR